MYFINSGATQHKLFGLKILIILEQLIYLVVVVVALEELIVTA